jgi:hypothetical protein
MTGLFTQRRGRGVCSKVRRVMIAAAIRPERLVFVDLLGAPTPRLRPCMPGRLKGSERAAAFRATGERTSRSWREHERERDGAVPGCRRPDNQAVFEAYLERVLAPLCAAPWCQVVVMDNLGAHRPKRVKELIEARAASCSTCPPTPRT